MKAAQILVVGAMLACAGCAAPNPVPEPNAITLTDALVSTVDALNAAYRESHKKGNVVFGYYPCTVVATYNISATGLTDNKLALGASGGIAQGVSLSANVSAEKSYTGTRGNQVTLVFASRDCLPDAKAQAAKPAAPAGGGELVPFIRKPAGR